MSAKMVNNDEITWSGVDASLRPPEIIIEASFDTKVDVWMIGCAVRFCYILVVEVLIHFSDAVIYFITDVPTSHRRTTGAPREN